MSRLRPCLVSLPLIAWLGVGLLSCRNAEGPGPRGRQGSASEAPPPSHVTAELALVEGLTDSGPIALGDRRLYQATLPTGWFIEIEAEQAGVDFALVASGPGGWQLLADSPTGRHGPERLLFWTATTGPHAVELRANDVEAGAHFTLHVLACHAGSAEERRRAQAFATGAAADHERRSQDPALVRQAEATYLREAAAWYVLGEVRGQLHAYDGLGRVADHLHLRARKVEASRHLAQLYARVPDVGKEAEALVDLGEALSEMGQPQTAVEAELAALRLIAQAPHAETEARAWNALANSCQMKGELGQAWTGFNRSLVLWQQLRRPRDEAITRANLAILLVALGEPQRALDELRRARGALPSHPAPQDEAFLLEHEAETLIRLGRPAAARQLTERAIALCTQGGDARALASALNVAA
ncbi:MAG: tetratricopeptide repeat protein, partial [Acidobacteriota bacterium]|nr:tetratricopeptide repeat protein [Acidobacteriota bacterium]